MSEADSDFISGHLRETPADLEVKRRLLAATSRHLNEFVDKFIAKATSDNPYNDDQKAVAWAAKKFGFLIRDVRDGAAIKNRHGKFTVIYDPDTMKIKGVKP